MINFNRLIIISALIFFLFPFIFMINSVFSIISPDNWHNIFFPWTRIEYTNNSLAKSRISVNNNPIGNYGMLFSSQESGYVEFKLPGKGMSFYSEIEFFNNTHLSGLTLEFRQNELYELNIDYSEDGFFWTNISKKIGFKYEETIRDFEFSKEVYPKYIRIYGFFENYGGYFYIKNINFYYDNYPTMEIFRKYFMLYNTYMSNQYVKPYTPLLNSLVLSIVVGLCNAMIFLLLNFYSYMRKSRLLAFITSIAISLPFPVFLVPQFKIITSMGLLNTYIGLIFPFFVMTITLHYSFFFSDRLPKEYYEIFSIEGGSISQFFRKVFISYRLPQAFMIFLMSATGFFNAFIWPLMVVQTDNMKTLTLATLEYKSAGVEYVEQIRFVSQFFLIAIIFITLVLCRKIFFKVYEYDDK